VAGPEDVRETKMTVSFAAFSLWRKRKSGAKREIKKGKWI
jgi:hypothetical protein